MEYVVSLVILAIVVIFFGRLLKKVTNDATNIVGSLSSSALNATEALEITSAAYLQDVANNNKQLLDNPEVSAQQLLAKVRRS